MEPALHSSCPRPSLLIIHYCCCYIFIIIRQGQMASLNLNSSRSLVADQAQAFEACANFASSLAHAQAKPFWGARNASLLGRASLELNSHLLFVPLKWLRRCHRGPSCRSSLGALSMVPSRWTLGEGLLLPRGRLRCPGKPGATTPFWRLYGVSRVLSFRVAFFSLSLFLLLLSAEQSIC